MRALILLAIVSISSFGQGISNKWFPLNWGNGTVPSCAKEDNAVISGELQVLQLAASVNCGNSTIPLAAYSYTVGTILMNTASFTYGNIAYRAAMPQATSSGTSAVWLLGASNASFPDCRAILKVGTFCLPGPTGYTEIDMTEILFSKQNINQSLWHAGIADSCTASVTFNTQYHDYIVIWSPTAVTWYVDGVQTCQKTTNIPTGPMFALYQVTISSVHPADYPSMLHSTYFRQCSLATAPNPGDCTASAAASDEMAGVGFDDEFNQTSGWADIYVAQAAAGNNTGLSCANAMGVLNFQQVGPPNDPGYWTNGMIGPGTTIHLCGVISTSLAAQGDGTALKPIIVKYEPGSTASFSTNGHSFINVIQPIGGGLIGNLVLGGPTFTQ